MVRYKIIILALSLCILQAKQTQAQTDADSSANKNTDKLKIVVTSLEVNDKALKLSYEIENNSDSEVWICEKLGFYEPRNSEICLAEDNQLLTIRRRLDVPAPGIVWLMRPLGKYIRLLPGKKRYESLSVNVPVDVFYIFGPRRSKQVPKDLFYVSHLAIEIGYYVGNLPEMILNMLEEAENTYNNNTEKKPQILTIFGEALTFNYFREQLRNRDEQILIPYTYQEFKGEKLLRTSIDGIRIPCKKRIPSDDEIKKSLRGIFDFGPDLKTCTKLQIRYKPSALEYFFPFAINQSLLSCEEIKYLQSEKTFIVEDQNILKSFAKEIINGSPFYGIVRENNTAHFDCYHNNDHLTSFTLYGDMIVETEEKKRLSYQKDFLNIGMLTPEIQKLEYRVQCAVNLRDLYYRLRFYNLIVARRQKESPVKKDVVIYPKPTNWFGAIISPGTIPKSIIRNFTRANITKPNVCPSVGEGKSTYAMNPNCEPNSPPDMVLLFETKDGWNQHGGPELFTFGNHDPKGGCVLLNDGTVKFIRTKEELQQLRWK